jgi:hypothetical protein
VLLELGDGIELAARESRLRERQREQHYSEHARLHGVFPK